MMETLSRSKFLKYFVAGLCWMIFSSLLNNAINKSWLIKRMETANLDALFSGKKLEVSKDIFVVLVTDDDYNSPDFKGASPLNPASLIKIIEAILKCDPKVLGVDFDTSAWTDKQIDTGGVPVVWAREALGKPGKLTLGKALGGTEDICSGVPAYFPDEDGFVREYEEYIEGAGGQYYPSLALNLAEVYKDPNGGSACRHQTSQLGKGNSVEPQLINFLGQNYAFDHLSSEALVQLANSPAWLSSNPLKGKIVLLGGSYRAARDAYPTPFGYLDGVDIIANTVQSRLPGSALNQGPQWLTIFGYLEGVVLLAGLYFVPKNWSLLITVLTGPIYALAINWLAFQWAGAFISFVPCLVGIFVHQVITHIKAYRKLERENLELQKQVQELRQEAPE
jgi:CHASE2 domain-containing sensor protein